MRSAEKIRVLYLSYDGLTDPLGESQILPYLIGLSQKGYQITIISFEKPDRFKIRKSEIEGACAKAQIRWVPLQYHKYPLVLSTLYDIYTLKRRATQLFYSNQYSIIHCRSYITSLVGLTLKRKFAAKFIFDMRGFWADERVEGGLWNLKNPIFRMVYSFFKKKEKQFLEEANQVVSLTNNAKEEIESWGINNAQITVIPTCVDLDLFDPAKIKKEQREALRVQLGIKPGDFILLYLGSWGTWYLTKEMLDFFLELKKQKPEAKFLIVTQDEINLSDYPHQKDVIVSIAQRNMVPLFISLADVSIFFIKPTFSKKASSATKMGEIVAMNVPVITNKGWGDVERLFLNFNKVFLLPDFSIQSTIDSLYWKSNEYQKDRPKDLSYFDLRTGVDKYSDIYRTLLN